MIMTQAQSQLASALVAEPVVWDAEQHIVGVIEEIDAQQGTIILRCPTHREHAMHLPLSILAETSDAGCQVTATGAELRDCRYCPTQA